RLVLAEPAATRIGRAFYRAFHHEPCDPETLRAPWVFGAEAKSGEFANMGMAWALFVRDRANVAAPLAEYGLAIAEVSFRDGLAYPATGGLSKPALLPAPAIRGLLRIEQRLPQRFWRFWGLRMIVVLEKTGTANVMSNQRPAVE
ncbi:MAG TPA: hypothetical protein VEA63_08965, partial [Opitutus sp.]|nr:hypothetical protein [Opitutus sp.]